LKTAPKVTHFRALVDRKNPRLQPPAVMPTAQQAIWHQTVDSLPSDWFSAEQSPLLVAYCQHVCRGAQLEAALATLNPLTEVEIFDKICKLAAGESAKILALARALRLTVQSRLRAETAFNAASGAASAARTWQDDLIAS
jgi:hypothetical protein